jgi:hypothetical protein
LAGNRRFRSNNQDRRFESILLHHPIRQFLYLSENRSKSARVRVICYRERTRRTPLCALSARIGQNLSRRDLPRSAQHAGNRQRIRTSDSPDHRLRRRMPSFQNCRDRAICVRDGGDSETAARSSSSQDTRAAARPTFSALATHLLPARRQSARSGKRNSLRDLTEAKCLSRLSVIDLST